MRTSLLLRSIWFAGGLALLLGWARERVLGLIPPARTLAQLEGASASDAPWFSGGFIANGAYPTTTAGLLPAHIPHVGSWNDGDSWQGRSESAWFAAARGVVRVGVAGYPQLPECKLWAEFRRADGTTTRVNCPLANPREQWNVWEIRRPAGATAVRLVGEDHASGHAGWLAFSHPFTGWPSVVTAVYHQAQIYTTVALVLTLLWGPALLWFPRSAAPEIRAAFLVGTGPLSLAGLGLLIWIGGGWIRPQMLGLILVTVGWLALGLRAWRRGFTLEMSDALGRVLTISALLVVAVVAKSFHSVGPQGELFRGTVSRNFEMADRIDSRYSFYVVQAAAHHLGPSAPAIEKFFSPWTFFSRGPLAGLVTTPIVMATGGMPPTTLPDDRWSPFDRTGFAAYRITMITIASGVIVALFLMLVPFVGEKWATIAAGLLALSPFGVHEMMFTWPKWVATAWMVASFGLAHARRPLAAGFTLGIGFLFHPLVLLWGPWLALWCAGRSERHASALAKTLLRFGAGAAVLVVPWMALGAWMPHLSTTPLAGQSGFFRYWLRADWKIATWDSWWHTRWMNFANTFIPLHGYLAEASFNHPKLNSAYEASGRLVKFSQLWWNSLPFAMGLGLWALTLAALARAIRSRRAATILFVCVPALFVSAYWGMDPLGLMRECGHPLFVALIAITCVVAARHGGWLRTVLLHPSVPWLQLPETWLMLWLTTLLNPAPWAVECDQLDGLGLGINALALFAAACVLAKSRKMIDEPAVAVGR